MIEILALALAVLALAVSYSRGLKRGRREGAAEARLGVERVERKGMRPLLRPITGDGPEEAGYCMRTPRCILHAGHVGRCVE